MTYSLLFFQGGRGNCYGLKFFFILSFCAISLNLNAQQRVIFGKGNTSDITVFSSSQANNENGIKTLTESGYLPNKNSARGW